VETTGAPTDADEATTTPRLSGPIVEVPPSPAAPPAGFVSSAYEHEWRIGRPRSDVWAWICDPATFTDGQIPPFRVEFLTNDRGETGFAEGVYNSHVGPLMSFAGVLGVIEPLRYRDLQYFYGSYAISHALFRPTRLQFWLDDADGHQHETLLRLRLDAFVREPALGVWNRMMRLFWKRFGSWCERAIPNDWRR
jgi:hypothetical protein